MIGQTLGQYRITAAIGAGGMGEVYRATDTKLGRDVALKLLPEAFAADPDRLARFEREAKVLASLNHPGIAHLYGFESTRLEGGVTVHFLAMELVEGEDLAERLKRGAIPVDEAVAIAKQVAEALEEAHEKGIVHRDLKPANVKVTSDGRVKVLDFGLAKAWSGESGGVTSSADLSQSPTLAHTGTAAGLILGTAAYMSPEQARGKAVDKRADIWAFGVVLWEMLTGRRLFVGETVSDVLAAVLTREPEWAVLPPTAQGRVRDLLRRCLERNPRQRLHDIADARILLEEAHRRRPRTRPRSAPGRSAGAPADDRGCSWRARGDGPGRRGPRRGAPPSPCGRASPVAQPLRRPAGEPLAPRGPRRQRRDLAGRRPDGRHGRGRGSPASLPARLRFPGPAPAPGHGGRHRPVLLARRALDRLLEGRAPQGVSRRRRTGQDRAGRLRVRRLESRGGDLLHALVQHRTLQGRRRGRNASAADPRRPGAGRAQPQLPGAAARGRALLFTSHRATMAESRVEALSLASGERHVVVENAIEARYLRGGYLAFVRDETLTVAPFDAQALRLTGPALPARHQVAVGYGNCHAEYALSGNGTLALIPRSVMPARREVVRLDRAGRAETILAAEKTYGGPALSPDGRQLALTRNEGGLDLLLYDLEHKATARLAASPRREFGAVWDRSGTRLFYVVDTPVFQIFEVPASGSGEPRRLLESPEDHVPLDVSPDGERLLYLQRMESLGVLPIARPRDERLLGGMEGHQNFGRFSPDGRFVAFQSDASGRDEVYVRPVDGSPRQPAGFEGRRAAAALGEERGAVLLAGRPALLRPGAHRARSPGRRAARAVPHDPRGQPRLLRERLRRVGGRAVRLPRADPRPAAAARGPGRARLGIRGPVALRACGRQLIGRFDPRRGDPL